DPGVELGETAAGGERRRMAVLLVDRPVAVSERMRDLRPQVLVEGSSLRDVDQLCAAADAEHWLSDRCERAHQRDFVFVADAVAIPLRPERFLAVCLRTDVG